MVVLNGIRGLEVTVRVSGRTAREYNNPDEDERHEWAHDDFHLAVPGRPLPHVVKYIEAKPGERFEVHVERTPQFQRVDRGFFFQVSVDGRTNKQARNDFKSRSTAKWSGTCAYMRSVKPTGTQQHYYKFANLDIGEVENLKSAELKEQAEKAKKWGTIIVRCYHSHGARPREWAISEVATGNGHGRISEKAVKGKALDAVTEFDSGAITPRSKKTETVIMCSDLKNRPFAIFEFRYRTKRGLVVEGIIPRTPSPTPEDRIQNMTDKELRRLARELLARDRERAKAPAVKEETKRGIKREIDLTDEDSFAAEVPPYKTQRRADGNLEIDLTELD